MSETGKSNRRWWLSDGFLGAMVVLLTPATAFAAYQSAITNIAGDDLVFEAQKSLVLATGSFLSGNTEFLEDLQNYDSYRFFVDQDPEEAAIYLERASEALRAGLERPGGPFDDLYMEARYGDAHDLISKVEQTEAWANQVDDKTRVLSVPVSPLPSAWQQRPGLRSSTPVGGSGWSF